MTGSRWTVLVLVLAALGLSVAYGLRGSSTPAASLGPLQRQAALAPCPAGLGPAFPDLRLPCLGGGPAVALQAGGTGRPTLVNVYGSWCGPCQKEMPVLRGFYARAQDKVALVGVDTEDPDRRLGLRFAIDMGQHWPAVADDERLVGAHFQPGVPLMVFVDAAGKVTHVESGGYDSGAVLAKDVRTYLGITV
ncbi:MAG: alkyl hydroperoxide reductase/Thiol specific antioxidant/Mal allergen [Frankiales bacterium]|nr:alkyl hydroperoxide reductase/Thiol specific antioxidant/Mal allergen [Frankiales bacterium]